jgi:hypothetical protein
MKQVPPIFRINALGTARRRRLVEKMLRAMHVRRRRAVYIASFVR